MRFIVRCDQAYSPPLALRGDTIVCHVSTGRNPFPFSISTMSGERAAETGRVKDKTTGSRVDMPE